MARSHALYPVAAIDSGPAILILASWTPDSYQATLFSRPLTLKGQVARIYSLVGTGETRLYWERTRCVSADTPLIRTLQRRPCRGYPD